MKKFISMVMAAAMVVSLVPATAFAASATLKVDSDMEWTKQDADKKGTVLEIDGTQLQLKLTDVDGKIDYPDTFEIDLKFDNAEMMAIGAKTDDLSETDTLADGNEVFSVAWYDKDTKLTTPLNNVEYTYDAEDSKVTLLIKEQGADADDFQDGDTIYININGGVEMTSKKVGATATVKVTGDLGDTDAKVIASILDEGIDAEIDDTKDIAEDEVATLEDITIEPTTGTFGNVLKEGDKITLKLSKGFEFVDDGATTWKFPANSTGQSSAQFAIDADNDDELVIEFEKGKAGRLLANEIVLSGVKIGATTAKAGDVATITVKGSGLDSVKIEVATVVAQGLTVSVDEDEDVPVMWSGVDAANTHLTADADEHEALEVTIEETFAGSFDRKDEIEFVLPEGVWVTGVEFGDTDFAASESDLRTAFENAYKKGDHKSFVFEKRTLAESDPDDPAKDDAMAMDFTLTLVADPGFVGDVELEMLVDGESIGKVVIAKFESPLTIEAQQNDLKIDYRNTEVPTNIVVKEAEAGLWEKGFTLGMGIDYMRFEDDLVYTVNEDESDMEIDGKDNDLFFEVDEESDEEAAVIEISNISLYMNRSLAAGAYDLEITSCNAIADFNDQKLFAPDETTCTLTGKTNVHDEDKECYVSDVTDYSEVVKEGFINIITAGREQDDASFTTKVVVPVGEMYIIAGENQIALDVPAYVNAEGYTMLPVRAVAVALGINTENVLWNQAAKQVTILYGQRIITMTAGQKVINVNGSTIPASAAVEIVNGRTFLPMRDLATALGVTDITWDQATKTATLNGNQK